jgi:hypothetical protein
MRPHPSIEVWGVTITSGEGWRAVRLFELSCSKVQLVGAFKEVLETERFKAARRYDGSPMRGIDVLKRELRAFKVRVTQHQNEVFGADSGNHDDCVLCVSLPVWAGSLPYMQMKERPDSGDDPGFHSRETTAFWREAVEEATALQAEEEAIERGLEAEEERRRLEQARYRDSQHFADSEHCWIWNETMMELY